MVNYIEIVLFLYYYIAWQHESGSAAVIYQSACAQ